MREGFLRRWLRGESEDATREEDAELVQRAAGQGATPIAECAERDRVRVVGTVESLTVAPRAGSPALEAELYDGTDRLVVVWLGRRKVAGVAPGRLLAVSGRIARQHGRTTMFNPEYELLTG